MEETNFQYSDFSGDKEVYNTFRSSSMMVLSNFQSCVIHSYLVSNIHPFFP